MWRPDRREREGEGELSDHRSHSLSCQQYLELEVGMQGIQVYVHVYGCSIEYVHKTHSMWISNT